MSVRIPPVTPAHNPADFERALGGLTPSGSAQALDGFGTLAHHPKLLCDDLRSGPGCLSAAKYPIATADSSFW